MRPFLLALLLLTVVVYTQAQPSNSPETFTTTWTAFEKSVIEYMDTETKLAITPHVALKSSVLMKTWDDTSTNDTIRYYKYLVTYRVVNPKNNLYANKTYYLIVYANPNVSTSPERLKHYWN